MKYDLHIYSKYSSDGVLEPEKIVQIATKKGLNEIAITDPLHAKRWNKSKLYHLKYTPLLKNLFKIFYPRIIPLFNRFNQITDFFSLQNFLLIKFQRKFNHLHPPKVFSISPSLHCFRHRKLLIRCDYLVVTFKNIIYYIRAPLLTVSLYKS